MYKRGVLGVFREIRGTLGYLGDSPFVCKFKIQNLWPNFSENTKTQFRNSIYTTSILVGVVALN